MTRRWAAAPDAWLHRRSEFTILAIGFVLVAGLGLLDWSVAPDLAPLVYLGPVSFVAWYGGRWPADLIALASGVAWFFAHSAASIGVSSEIHYWDAIIRLGASAVFGRTIAVLRGSLDRERESARTDPLTGIANLRALSELAEVEIAFARRYKRPLTAIYADLDSFKTINDRMGHAVGDEVLRAVARAIRGALRVTDLVARLGGDEFFILLPETNSQAAGLVIQKVRDALTNAELPSGAKVEATLGVVTYPLPPVSLDDIIEAADRLMYEAKRHSQGEGSGGGLKALTVG